MVGFQRFLYLVGNHDWKNSPLMVNLNDEFTGKFLITGVNWSTCTGLCVVYIGTITHVQSILCIGIMLNLEDESIGIFMYQNQRGELLTLTFTWNIKRLTSSHCSTAEDYQEILGRFQRERSSRPLMSLSTPYDKHASSWTRHAPSAPLLQRLVVLARGSLDVLNRLIQEGADNSSFKVKKLNKCQMVNRKLNIGTLIWAFHLICGHFYFKTDQYD